MTNPTCPHACGICDGPVKFDYMSGSTPVYRCADIECDWVHWSTDCCEPRLKELHENDVLAAVRILFPDAELTADEDAGLTIKTGCIWSGHVGDQILGHMNIEGLNLLSVKDMR